MRCESVIERLPWSLNRSLDPEERDAVREHLERCPECRRELAATAEVGRLFGTHLPTDALVALAFDEVDREKRAAAERHLENCAACRAELALAEASAEAERVAIGIEPAPVSRGGPAPWLLAAAALIAAVLAAGAVYLWQEDRSATRWAREQNRLEERLETLERERAAQQARVEETEAELDAARERLTELEARTRAEASTERSRVAVLEGRVRDLGSPRAGHPVLELLPEELVLRSGDREPAIGRFPEEAEWVTVLLSAPGVGPEGAYRIELREEGRVVWRSEPTAPEELGGFSLLLPAALLRDQGRELVVVSDDAGPAAEPVATYPLD